ncbi:MAG: hypothetical protein AAF078_02130 [Planctomycetota bacterium]
MSAATFPGSLGTLPTSRTYVDRVALQNRLLAELSAIFGGEVPLHDKPLAVNRVATRFPRFALSDG